MGSTEFLVAIVACLVIMLQQDPDNPFYALHLHGLAGELE